MPQGDKETDAVEESLKDCEVAVVAVLDAGKFCSQALVRSIFHRLR